MSNALTTTNKLDALMDIDKMVKMMEIAAMISKSNIIPKHYQGNPSNTFVAMQKSLVMGIDVHTLMESSQVIYGTLTLRARYAINLAHRSGLLAKRIRYEVRDSGKTLKGKTNVKDEKGYNQVVENNYRDMEVTAFFLLKDHDQEISFTVSMKHAIAEGWIRNEKYLNIPELMLQYRAATLLIGTHIPEVLYGMYTTEEIEDIGPENARNITPPTSRAEALSDKLSIVIDKIHEIEEPITLLSNVENVEPMEYQEILSSKLKDLVEFHGISAEKQAAWCAKAGVMEIEELPEDSMQKCISHLCKEYGDIPPSNEYAE